MIGYLAPYQAYKDASVPWLGRVPSHWRIIRGKWLFRSRKEINSEGVQQNVLSLTLRGVVNNDLENPEGLVPKDYRSYQIFRKGDLVFKLIDLENLNTSRVGLVHEDGIMSPAYLRLTLQHQYQGLQKFFYYQYFDLYLRGIFNQLGAGVRSTLGVEDLLNLPIVVPPIAEQAAILRYLEHVEQRIRHYTRVKQKLITLLNEQKQMVVKDLVTRGSHPAGRLKASGLDWLPEIPESWEVRRNQRLFRERKASGRNDLPILVVSLNTGVTVGADVDVDGRPRRTIENRNSYKIAHASDLAYNMMRMWQGAVGVCPCDGLVSPAYVVAEPNREINPHYFALLFRTEAYKNEVNRNSRGIVSDRNRLYWDDFKQMKTPVPPPPEQSLIVQHVRRSASKIERAIQNIQAETLVIKEYQTRLISDLVTGKLDVRDASAKLPELRETEVASASDGLPDGMELDRPVELAAEETEA